MPLDNWLAFVAAAAILIAVPGPTTLLVVSYAFGHGWKRASGLAAGVALGDLTAMTASVAGLGAILAASAELFTILRWVGAAYLVYLGVRLWRAPVGVSTDLPAAGAAAAGTATAVRPARILGHVYAVTALNPKSLMFYLAFVPQFVSAKAAFFPQVAIMVATLVPMAASAALAYALIASAAQAVLKTAAVQRAANRTGGSLLIGSGFLAAVAPQTPA